MRYAIGIHDFHWIGSHSKEKEQEAIRHSALNGFGKFFLTILRAVGFIALATLWAWPGVAYLAFLAMNS